MKKGEVALPAVETTVTVKPWGDMGASKEYTGSAVGLGTNHMAELEDSGPGAHSKNERFLQYGILGDNQTCARVLRRGYIGSPIMGALYLGDPDWAS